MIKKQFIGYTYRSYIKDKDYFDKVRFPIEWRKNDITGEKVLHTFPVGFPIYKNKGRKIDWDDEDWPPVKIKITIEVFD